MPTLRVTEITIGGPDVMRRGAGKIIKKAMASSIAFWHREFAPKHFKREASGQYRYQRRKAKYTESKFRKFGHRQPLVLTGNLRDQVLRKISIRGTAKRLNGVMAGPKYLFQFNKQVGAPDKAKELTTTTKTELKRKLKLVDEQTTRGFNRLREQKVRRIS